jgi:predicted NACHT family NTPase
MSDLPLPDLAAAYPVVKEALHAFAPTIRKGAGNLARNIIDKAVASLQIGFAPYLNTSYDRCKSVKTLLSQDKPLQLLEIYVHLNLKCKNDIVNDDSLINNLSSYNRIVITGLAGAGKSLFLKYLTICRFHNPCGTIPVFVELRQLNAITSKNLLAYIHQACASANSKVTYDQFELALQAGGLLLVLDGFDEIDFSHRDIISQQILDIARKYPAVPMVISSRPDVKFGAW